MSDAQLVNPKDCPTGIEIKGTVNLVQESLYTFVENMNMTITKLENAFDLNNQSIANILKEHKDDMKSLMSEYKEDMKDLMDSHKESIGEILSDHSSRIRQLELQKGKWIDRAFSALLGSGIVIGLKILFDEIMKHFSNGG